MYDFYGRYIPDNPYPYGRNLNQAMQQMQPMKIIHVNGRGGADAYQMPANSEALLLDDTAAIIWLKTTDGAGYPALTPYSITPYQPEPQVSTADIVNRLNRLEEIVNGKPDYANASAPASDGKHK